MLTLIAVMPHLNFFKFFSGLGFNGFKSDIFPPYILFLQMYSQIKRMRDCLGAAACPQCQVFDLSFLGDPMCSPNPLWTPVHERCELFTSYINFVIVNLHRFSFNSVSFVCPILNSWQWTTGKASLGIGLCLNAGCCNYSFLYEKKVMFALNSLLEENALHFWCV